MQVKKKNATTSNIESKIHFISATIYPCKPPGFIAGSNSKKRINPAICLKIACKQIQNEPITRPIIPLS